MIHLMVGIQGSGKSTFSKQLAIEKQIQIISTDGVRKIYPELPEKEIWPLVYRLCAEELNQGKDVIFDATSITIGARTHLKEQVKCYCDSFQVGCYFFLTDLSLCKHRVQVRNQMQDELYLPIEVVEQFYNRLIPPTLDEGFVFIKTLNSYGDLIQIEEIEDDTKPII